MPHYHTTAKQERWSTIHHTMTQRDHTFNQTLARIRHLETLPAKVQDDLARAVTPHRYRPGQIIYMKGDTATAVYFLAKGWVKAARISCGGREQATMFLYAEEVFGDVAVITEAPYLDTVTALETVEVWRIPAHTFREQMTRHPSLTLAFAKRLGERVRYFADLVEDLSLCSVEKRVARTLLRYARLHNERCFVPRQGWTTLDEMAVRLGTVRDVLGRALKALEKEHLIAVHKQEIIILDPDGLAARGEPDRQCDKSRMQRPK